MKYAKWPLFVLSYIATWAYILFPSQINNFIGREPITGGRTIDLQQVIIDEPLYFVTTTRPLAAYRASQNLLCDYPILSITRAIGSFAANFSIGTTTASSTAVSGFTTPSTKTLVTSTPIGTTTVAYIGPGFGVGGVIAGTGTWYSGLGATTTFPWPFSTNEWILVYSDFAGATSTTSTLPAGGFTLQGRLKVRCWTNS